MSLQSPFPPVAQQAESCAGCGAELSPDQRYCLSCGRRRGQPRIEYERYLDEVADPLAETAELNGAAEGAMPGSLVPANGEGAPPDGIPPVRPVAASPPADDRPEREVTPLMAAAGLVMVALILLVGVLLGRSANGGSQAPQQVIAAAPAATPGAATTTASSTTVEVALDWPSGQEGFTIELATLSKEGADGAAVDAAKADLTAQGASEVGVLDSDEFGSLPGGNYLLYSGVYDTKGEASKALDGLKADFPDAQVVEVAAEASSNGGGGGQAKADEVEQVSPEVAKESAEALESLEDASGAEYEELQKKLPSEIATPGEAPPKDNKPPGGDAAGDAVEIG